MLQNTYLNKILFNKIKKVLKDKHAQLIDYLINFTCWQ